MRMRCLIVDDSQDFLASARRLLDSQGVEVVGVATTSAAALGLLDDLEPDIALIDVELGDEDGIALADELVARAPGLGVVLISSHDRAELSELLADSRAAGFLPKTDLGVEAICNLLGRAA
jgi:DNA-binding NarL/FixJ family response regulator